MNPSEQPAEIRLTRPDGRQPREHRSVEIHRGFLRHAEGSAMITQGATRVICAASISAALPDFRRGTGGGWVTAEYAMLPRSTGVRSPRVTLVPNKRAVEISRFLGRCLRAVVDLSAMGPWLIQVDCDVVDADGGTRCAALTGGFVALADAMQFLVAREKRPAWPLRELVAGISIARIEERLVVDPCYEEDHRAAIDLTMAVTGSGRIVELHAASEASPYERATLDAMVTLGIEGAHAAFAAQRACGDPCGRDRAGHCDGEPG
ncbi:MAG: ribonuclease PH [Candidatus Eisenbacteria bacterium]|nr:ribonuclease PH [Candidatus Eisenbacteria bacterium]